MVAGNDIGTNKDGTAALGNGSCGVRIYGASNNTIGGAAAGAGNLISGNALDGVAISGPGATGNIIAGNLVGTNAAGTAALANGNHGVSIFSLASGNTVGGTTAAARNVISGNTLDGVFITGSGTTGNVVEGNYIGTDVTGTQVIANAQDGVLISAGASNNTIGGLTSTPGTGAGNVISGNTADAVQITGAGTNNNTVLGNLIGTNAAGAGLDARVTGWFKAEGTPANAVGGSPATLVGGTTYAAGEVGQGFQFNGTGAAVTTAITNDYRYGVSYEVWLQTTATGGFVIGDAGSNAQVGTALTVEAGRIVFHGFRGNAASGNFTLTGPLVNDGTFHHIVAVWSGVGGNVVARPQLYVDGVLVASGPATQRIDPFAGLTPTTTVTMGGPAGPLTVAPLNGVIDEATIYGRPLMAQEAAAQFALGAAGKSNRLNNGGSGVRISGGAASTTIGGATSTARNVFGDNATGITVDGAATTGVTIQNNFIGTDATGYLPLATWSATTGVGIALTGGVDGVQIGGIGAGNVISGNTVAVSIGIGSSNTVLQGNTIGLGPDGDTPVSNYDGGVLSNGANTRIGGAAAGAGNVISANSNYGVLFQNASGGQLLGNLIGTDKTGTKNRGNLILSTQTSAFGTEGVIVEVPNVQIGGTNPGEGNVISGSQGLAILFWGANTTGGVVEGNKIGTDINGTSAIPNLDGILFFSGAAGITIGGTTAAARNLISGNVSEGIWAQSTSSGNTILGNYIGTDASGTLAIPNGDCGIFIQSDNNTIGGATPGAGNLISGNVSGGIAFQVQSNTASNNKVLGNFIGTDKTGTLPLGNGAYAGGVSIGETSGVQVGGPNPGEGNVISGNLGNGVTIAASASWHASGNLVEGNFIGTDKTGLTAIANSNGVVIQSGAQNNTIGGFTSTPGTGAGNLISGNTTYGVYMQSAGTTANVVRGNLIGLGSDGTTLLTNQTGVGLVSSASGNIIGGDDAADGTVDGQVQARNVIGTGTNCVGIYLLSTGNQIEGNYIGTDRSGLHLSGPRGLDGIYTQVGPNTIGGTTAGAGNVIAGGNWGIYLRFAGASGTVVQGNFIGTDATGTAALPNVRGIEIDTSNVTIGGTTPGARNVISGNSSFGIEISDYSGAVQGNVVEGNYIGTDKTGTVALPNGGDGVDVSGVPAYRSHQQHDRRHGPWRGQPDLGQRWGRRRPRVRRRNGQHRRREPDRHERQRLRRAAQSARRCVGRCWRLRQHDRWHHGRGPERDLGQHDQRRLHLGLRHHTQCCRRELHRHRQDRPDRHRQLQRRGDPVRCPEQHDWRLHAHPRHRRGERDQREDL